jgi:glyoxylase-like metal-dependent hydrolase (beta-lactamase superfamily II)
MLCADDFDSLRDGVFFWQAYDPAVKVDLSCCARRTEKGLVFIDPIPLAQDALERLCASCRPVGIVLTNGNHERAARGFRDDFQIPIWGHRDAQSELGGCLDHFVEAGETIFDELTAIALPGAGPGEIALHGGGFLHTGDALIHLPQTGLAILPSKYCADFKELRRSLRKLLSFRFDALTFAHGLPIIARGFQRISQLLE